MGTTKLKLLVVVNVYAPDLGGGVLFADLCEGLAERGIDVTVRCAYPYYPEWKDKTGENGFTISRSDENGVRVERHGIFIPKNPESLLQRLLYEASFYFSLSRGLLRRGNFNGVMVYCPLVGAVAFGWMYKVFRRVPFWLNVQDLSADAAAASGIVTSKSTATILSGIQSFLFNRSNVWSSISPPMVTALESIARKQQQVFLFPNWVQRSLADAIRNARPTSPHASPGKPVRILYSGNLGTKQHLLEFCKTLAEADLDFRLQINAGGSGVDQLRRWNSNRGDRRFEVDELLPESDFAQALVDADYFLITERPNVGGSFVPSKLIPGLMSRTPIWSVCDPTSPLGEEAKSYQFGPTMTWDDLPQFLAERSHQLNDGTLYQSWSKNAAERALHFDRTRVIDDYAAKLTVWMKDSR